MAVALSVLPVVAVASPAAADHSQAQEIVLGEIDAANGEGYADGLRKAADQLGICQQAALRVGAYDYGTWGPWSEPGFTNEGGFTWFRDKDKENHIVETDLGSCVIDIAYVQVGFNDVGPWVPRRVTIRAKFDRTHVDSGTSKANGRSYSAVISSLVSGLSYCGSEVGANASRSSGTWGFGNPVKRTIGFGDETVRDVTKNAVDGNCSITYVVTELWDYGWNRLVSVSVTVREYLGTPPPAAPPPEGKGDKRHGCSPAQADFWPHLCLSVHDRDNSGPRSSLRLRDDDRLPAPQKCDDCDDPPGDDPPGGDDNGGGVGGSVGEPLQLPIPEPEHRETPAQKGDRLIENMKRYDELCKVDPALVCGDYPFHEWVS